MSWRLAKALDELRAEVDERWPNRSRVSDGTIGDAEHATRDSDHNPWVKDARGEGVVTAIDITGSDADRPDIADFIVHTIIRRRDKRVKYVIHDRQIWRSYNKPGIPAWTPAPYMGKNAHLKHVHVSVKPEPAAYDSTVHWGVSRMPSRVDKARELLRAARPNRPKGAQAKIDAALHALEGVQ